MYIYIVALLVKNTENISEFLLCYLVTKYFILFPDLFCASCSCFIMWQAARGNFWEIATVAQNDGET
jgi:hypothetical protein